MRVAWMMSGFPRFTETFVLNEIRASMAAGVDCVIYPLRRDRPRIVQPGAAEVVGAVRHVPFVSPKVLAAQLWWIANRPIRYVRAFAAALVGTWGSVNFFVSAVGLFPKVAAIARLMQRENVTHVHCHFATHAALAGFVIHRLTGIPYSFTAHGSDLLKDRHMLPQKVTEAAFVVAISRFNRDLIVRECGGSDDGKIHVVHCGIDLQSFSMAQRVPSGRFSILCVGRIAPWKGQVYLIDACARLARRGVPFRCTIVGDGGSLDELRGRIDAAGLNAQVELLGWKTQPEVAELMRSADVLVAPSAPARGKQEGIPVTLMEGMATGLAVVATSITGVPELVLDGRTGLLVRPADADALADALERLHADRALRERLGRGARKHVAAEFDLHRNAARLLELIEGVA